MLYTGHQIAVIKTVSLEDCVDYCISSKLCRGVMFVEEDSMCELKYAMIKPMAANTGNVQSVRIECFREEDDMEAMKGTLCLAGVGIFIFIAAMACRRRERKRDRVVEV